MSQPKRWRGAIVSIAVFISLVTFASASMAEPRGVPAAAPDASAEPAIDLEFIGLSALDAVVLRPFGVVSTLGGFVIFLASTPFVAPSGNIATSWDIFVYGSYDYTFARPLGEI